MLVLNHKHSFHAANDLGAYPAFVPFEQRQELSVFDHILWVTHPGSNIQWPWLVEANERNFLDKLDRGFDSLTPNEIKRGLQMGILVDHKELANGPARFANLLKGCREQIATKGFCVIPTTTFDTYYFTVNYYVNCIASQMTKDTQVPLRNNKHNAALFKAVHSQLAFLVQTVANEPLKPSYCYLSLYPEGSELVKHVDRAQCKWNASITFARTDAIWPIYVETPDGTVHEVKADLGELVIYKGTDLPHWRKPLPKGSSTVCFFHFVTQPYQGTLN
jgi:hypothetical protein